jgi:hypothetical protein
MEKCPTCDEFTFPGIGRPHQCKPRFECREDHNYPDDDDDAFVVIFAVRPIYAAEQWAEQDDCEGGEYSIVGGRHTPTVIVKDADGDITHWKVTGEAVPRYSAEAATVCDHEWVVSSRPDIVQGEFCHKCHAAKPNEPEFAGMKIVEDKSLGPDEFELVTQTEEDPTPWCHGCGAMLQADCHCGPIAENH